MQRDLFYCHLRSDRPDLAGKYVKYIVKLRIDISQYSDALYEAPPRLVCSSRIVCFPGRVVQ